ncbi:hypothetical protein ACHHYP_01388 [Achlya hypogyna]|uniref:PUM-HD domain-containing protein n=1 Tax=Achlya hypogyna TaxID=1202772 RepID=A0A1V9ZTK5_ACHHY|nr:hypothetical protein ACHHYP_01388 [Achlya hypogyna]
MLPFDMSLLDLQAKPGDADFTKNYAIGSRIQRSMSAPPVAEHVGRLPAPMYAQSEYNDNQMEGSLRPEYYYYYAPKSHNPRLPMSYNAWESMHKHYNSRNIKGSSHHGSSLHRVQIPNQRDGPPGYPTSTAQKASQEDFEAAVAAAGGHSTYPNFGDKQSEPYCSSPTDSNHSASDGSVRPVNKTLIDRIQEDFPRTPSPVFGYGLTSEMEAEMHRSSRYQHEHMHSNQELPSDFLQSMKRLPLAAGSHGKSGRINIVSPSYYPVMYAPSMHYPIPASHVGGLAHPMYQRMARGMYPPDAMQYASDYGSYREAMAAACEQDYEHIPDIRHLGTTPGYGHSSSPPGYSRHTSLPFPEGAQEPKAPYGYTMPPKESTVRVPHNPRMDEKEMHLLASTKSATEKVAPLKQPAATSSKAAVAPRSVLLEDFRSPTKINKKWELIDVRGHVIEFAKDQHGSRFIQHKLETAKSDIKDIVFAEIYPVALTLMTDVFGNYVIQKFLDHGSPKHVTMLLRTIKGRVLELSLQMYGCRVIQKALELKGTPEKLDLIAELQGHVLKCVKDQNGNHVVQKCIEILPWKVAADRGGFILSAFVGNVYSLATHPYGCRVIQRVLEHCSEEQIAPILKEIHEACYPLVEDQYGNYVIQHVLQHGQPHERGLVISKMYPDIVRFSYHKFASNVIEKCLMYASAAQLRMLVQVVLQVDDRGQCPLQAMMKDQYANYVAQKLMDLANTDEREQMVAIVKMEASHLKRFNFGKHIISRLEKLVGYKFT